MDNLPENGKNSYLQVLSQVLITAAFVVGAVANGIALWILYKSSKTRNNKHVLMLRCLATNDLMAQFGMLTLMNLKRFQVIPMHWQCILYVCFRAFGIGSGCVAFVMAVERWLALTRPFVYQTVVTYDVVKRSVLFLWCSAAFLTYLPLFGFGLYYKDGKCGRYREATEPQDIAYAYGFLVFGSTISLGIVLCNISIIYELWRIGGSQRILVRRCSRSTTNKHSTAEEVAFAKLMAAVCLIFIVCWMPQMISIPLARFYPQSHFYNAFGKIADLLMCTYFALDPYVYVLQRYTGRRRCKLLCGKNCKLTGSSRTTSLNGTSLTSTATVIHLNNLAPPAEHI